MTTSLLLRPRHHREVVLEEEVQVALHDVGEGGAVGKVEDGVAQLGEAARHRHRVQAHHLLHVLQHHLKKGFSKVTK